MKSVHFAILLLLPCLASAQSKTTFGSTNAKRCYQESNTPFTDYGLRYCDAAIEEDDLLLKDLAATYTNRGIIYAANGQLDEAMRDHNEALLLTPDSGKVFINRGNVYHQLHEYDLALADYKQAEEFGKVPLDIVYYNRALTLIRMKRWDEAEAALETALVHNPDSSRVKKKIAEFAMPDEGKREQTSQTASEPADLLPD